MPYHKLLKRQIAKYTRGEVISPQDFAALMEVISQSYTSLDRDQELHNRAFEISQQEFTEMTQQLKEEVELKRISIQRLKSALNNIKSEKKDQLSSDDDDLLEIVDLLNEEINRRKEVERQLLLAKEEAEKASIAKSDFLSIMSHEIRTPLNAVIGMGHLLYKNNPRTDQLENLGALRTSADNLLVLINDILDFNKIEAGQLDLEAAAFNLKKVVKSIVSANANAANERSNRISLIFDDKIPDHFMGDALRLGQVLNNLVSNAVKFTQGGFIAVRVDLSELNEKSVMLNFSVQDTGVGIARENIGNIFLPFTQASTAITRKYGGTGLGLAITRKILALFNSDITVESELGKGAKFQFNIELEISGDDELSNLYQDMDFDLHQARILLVEDTLFNVLYASQLLESWNARVEVADNGEMAIDMLQSDAFDLVLMDLRMPIMDGYTATIKIREFNAEIPIIALTASATSNVRLKVIQAGMQDYVTKPLNPDELFMKIRKFLA